MSQLNGQHAQVLQDLTGRARTRLAEAPATPASPDERSELVAQTAAGIVREFQRERLQSGADMLADDEAYALTTDLAHRLHSTGRLRALLADPTVRDVWCQGWDVVWLLRVDGGVEPGPPFADSDRELITLIGQLAAEAAHVTEQERRFDPSSPILDLQLEDGSRLNSTGWLSKRPTMSIRKRRKEFASLADLEASGMLQPEIREFLTAAVKAKCNTAIAGQTGAGKTTLVRAMCEVMPYTERLITIEDVYELALDDDPAHGNVVAFQSRKPNTEGAGAVGMDELLECGLRMNPDRILIGEVRGNEALTMLMSMVKGGRGSLSTIHAETSIAALDMLTLHCIMAHDSLTTSSAAYLISRSLNLVVLVDLGANGVGHVASIREITGCNGESVASNELWRPGPDGRARPQIPPSHTLTRRLVAAGWQPPATWGRS